MILEMEGYAAICQVVLCCEKILAVSPQREMEHAVPLTRQRRTCPITSSWKKRKGRLPPCHENRNTFPHSIVAAFEPQDIDVPLCGTLNVPDGKRDVIESFQFKHAVSKIAEAILRKRKLAGVCRTASGRFLGLCEIGLAKMWVRRCVSTRA